jgi:aminoacyl tRNA synthase complex-interacting multifunctional protein 1
MRLLSRIMSVCLTIPPLLVVGAAGRLDAVPGVDFGSEGAAPFAEKRIRKQKVFEKIAPFLRIDKYGVPEFCGRPLLTSAWECTSPIANGFVS